MTWRDLSDDELRARLSQRNVSPPSVIDRLVDGRDDSDVAAVIDEWIVD